MIKTDNYFYPTDGASFRIGHANARELHTLDRPLKFQASFLAFVRRGSCRFSMDLVNYEAIAPALINISASRIVQTTYATPDFDADFIVLPSDVTENVNRRLVAGQTFSAVGITPVAAVPEQYLPAFTRFYQDLRDIGADKDNPYFREAIIYTITAFFFRIAYHCFPVAMNASSSASGRIATKFIILVQENFKRERFLDFYASKLNISPKHLSRALKAETGTSAVEWISRYVVLEAKVMLKSSNLSVQQIAEELNFPSQSFFGKYFKKATGLSPKEYRNT